MDERLTRGRDRFVIGELVSRCCHKLTLPADRVWEMSLPDIVLTLRNPDPDEDQTRLYDLDRRRELLARMATEERVEFEKMKADLM